MKALTYSFWAVTILVALLTTALIKLMTADPTPSDTCPENMVCYVPYGEAVEPEYVLEGTIVKVNFIDPADMPDGYEAYAQFTVDPNQKFSWCVITTTMPEHVLGDSAMDALGHELLHCLTGQFHTPTEW